MLPSSDIHTKNSLPSSKLSATSFTSWQENFSVLTLPSPRTSLDLPAMIGIFDESYGIFQQQGERFRLPRFVRRYIMHPERIKERYAVHRLARELHGDLCSSGFRWSRKAL